MEGGADRTERPLVQRSVIDFFCGHRSESRDPGGLVLSQAVSHREVPEVPEFLNDERWDLVQRIVSSRHFSKAPQLRDILIYICQRGIRHPTAVIKEHEIGCNVLGRKPDFNPYDDNIVRVQISHLRKKLEEYFSSDGKNEPIQIRVPRGAYLPRFEPHPQSPVLSEIVPGAAGAGSPEPVGKQHTLRWLPVVAIPILLTAILGSYFALRREPRALTPVSGGQKTEDLFWARLFGDGQPTSLVVSDTCLVMLRDVLHADVSVDEYSRHEFSSDLLRKVSDPGLRSALELIAGRQYTSLADTNIASKLKEISERFQNSQTSIRYARHLNIRDFKAENFILIGSRLGIPWVGLFEPQLNFTLEENRLTHRFHFRNKNPKPGESATYVPTEDSGTQETYADIAFLPNLENTGSVLILSGITMEASEAAGEMVTSSGFEKELERLLGSRGVRDQYFEILLKTRAVAGTARSSQVITHRIIQPAESS